MHQLSVDNRPAVVINDLFKHKLLSSTVPLEPKEASRGFHAFIGLLDLPNEILLSILELLEDELYTLACLSRRLHYLSLPIYLAHRGVNPFTGELILFDERSEDVLQALSIALFQPSLNRIYCLFDFYKPPSVVERDLRGLIRLVGRLSVLKEFHLDYRLEYKSSVLSPRPGLDDIRGVEIPLKTEREWARLFQGLLDAVLSKGCTTLTVCLVGWCVIATPTELVSAIWKNMGMPLPQRFFDNLCLNSFANTVQRVVSNLGPSWLRSSTWTFDTFNLHSAMLLQPQYIHWTLGTLNGSGLSTLSLKHLDIYPDSWAIILPRLTLPNLSHLSVDLCSIRYPDLARFLRRHSRLEDVYFGRSLSTPFPDAQIPWVSLPELTRLSATPVFLFYFLTHGGIFPKLEAVSVIIRVNRGHHFDFDVMNGTLLPISRWLHRVRLSLDISLESGSADWMYHEHSADFIMEGRIIPLVSGLEIRLGLYRFPRDVALAIPRWLTLFPGLKKVMFYTPSQDGPLDAAERLGFMLSVFRRCPSLENVGINGLVHGIEGWILEG